MTDARVATIMIDANDTERLVAFWTRLLGLDERFRVPGFVWLLRVSPGGPALAFQQVPEPKPATKNRLHLDIHGPDAAAILAKVDELGGTRLEERRAGDFTWTVCADPEGNEFCVAAE